MHGYSDSGMDSIKYNRSLRRKTNYFTQNAKGWVVGTSAKYKVKFSNRALERIKEQQRKDAVKLVVFLTLVIVAAFLIIKRLLF